MSFLDLGVTGWRAFWANVTAPGAIGLYLAILAIGLLAGFAMRRTVSLVTSALRVVSLAMAVALVNGLLGAVGIDLTGLTPVLNWLLRQIQAPFYVPEA